MSVSAYTSPTGSIRLLSSEKDGVSNTTVGSTLSGDKRRTGDLCAACCHPVYSLTKLRVDDKIFHKACFVCSFCHDALRPDDYHVFQNKFYCKEHLELKKEQVLHMEQMHRGRSGPSGRIVRNSLSEDRAHFIPGRSEHVEPMRDNRTLESMILESVEEAESRSRMSRASSIDIKFSSHHNSGVTQLSAEYNVLKDKYSSLEKDHRQLTNQHQRITENNKNLETAYKEGEKRCVYWEKRSEDLEQKLSDALSKMELMNEEIVNLKSNLQKLLIVQATGFTINTPEMSVDPLKTDIEIEPVAPIPESSITESSALISSLPEPSIDASSLLNTSVDTNVTPKSKLLIPIDSEANVKSVELFDAPKPKLIIPETVKSVPVDDFQEYEDDADEISRNYLAPAFAKHISVSTNTMTSKVVLPKFEPTPTSTSQRPSVYGNKSTNATRAFQEDNTVNMPLRRRGTSMLLSSIAVKDVSGLTPTNENEEYDNHVSEIAPNISAQQAAALERTSELQKEGLKLVLLAAWMEKKSPSLLMGWQKRFVAVADFNIYYGPNKFDVPFPTDPNVSKALISQLNCVPLLCVKSIQPKDKIEFEVEARDSKTGELRIYLFRTSNPADRNRWVAGLNEHRDHLMKMLQWTAMHGQVKIEFGK